MVKFLKKTIRRFLIGLFTQFPINKRIVFESNPDFSCNTYPVYLLMKKTDMLSDYEFVWWVKNDSKQIDKMDKLIFNDTDNIIKKIEFLYYMSTSKILIFSNKFITDVKRKDQIGLFLCHGSKTKKTKGFYEMGEWFDYINVQSHFFDSIITEEYGCKQNQLVYLGYPRCDYFYSSDVGQIRKKILSEKSERYILWLPTLRNTVSGRDDARGSDYNLTGIPLIYSKKTFQEFNEFLKMKSYHVIYKLHPAQDASFLINENMTNIHIITDEYLKQSNLQLYEVIYGSDALITDYSSVYYDYLLLDKPIATTIDDLDAWKNGRGFAFDLEKIYDMTTERIANVEELHGFINHVADGLDTYKEARKKICKLTNMHQDGCSAQRVVDFIIDKIS